MLNSAIANSSLLDTDSETSVYTPDGEILKQKNEISRLMDSPEIEYDRILSAEARASVFTAAIQEDIESARPDYDYEATFDDIRAIEMKIIRLKHSISQFNLTTKVPGFGMTIDEMLVYIPQQTALKKKLDKMRSRLPKERINSGFSRTSNFIEYNYCDGKVDLSKLHPIMFDTVAMCYREIGDNIGGAWSAGKKFQ